MLNLKSFIFTLIFCVINNIAAYANSNATLGSITTQRSMLEDLNLQVQIQEQSQKLNQLLMPVIPTQQPGELTAKQLLNKLEVPKETTNEEEKVKTDEDNRSSKVIAIYSNNKLLKAKVKYKGKVVILTNGQMWNDLKIQIFRDHVLIGNKTLEL